MKRLFVILISIFLTINISSCKSPTSPDENNPVTLTIYVDINNKTGIEDGTITYPYTSIVKAVTKGTQNTLIIVKQGHYREPELYLKEGMKLQGAGSETTTIERSKYGLITLSSGCEISGFTIMSQWSGTVLDPAIKGGGVKNIRISNNRFKYPDHRAIFLEGSSGSISNNQISGSNKVGGGISINVSDEIVIENNLIFSSGYALSIIGSSPIIRNNTIRDCRLGIDISMAVGNVISSPLISNNTIENNDDYGIRIAMFPCNADLGGGGRGSPGENIIRNNRKYDLLNQSPSSIYAKNNWWTHSTEFEIDKSDISDDDEGTGGQVIFLPFKK
ncbi:MAG: DUF1565 domain-containing protein [Acidobacteriota bacterium]